MGVCGGGVVCVVRVCGVCMMVAVVMQFPVISQFSRSKILTSLEFFYSKTRQILKNFVMHQNTNFM